ncbi:MAG: DUF2157 domain-containing protein [Gloeotrichia echinulata CP02]
MLPDTPLKIELRLPSYHPQLLAGLDIWLRLGLISDAQVRQICRKDLVCQVILQTQALPQPQVNNVAFFDPVELLAVESLQVTEEPVTPAKPNFIATMLQSLGAELSVRWLLFLGLFLVVVSSGVLAASQWEKFPASLQYGVLLAYTLSFWGFSFWAGRQNNLRLTAQTLLIVTLLLIPVNFWAMDSFRLWQNPLDWLTVAIAIPTLTAITILLCNHRLFVGNSPLDKLPLVNILGLSYLHCGWKLFPSFPLIVVYVAMVGTTLITVYHHRYQQTNQPTLNENEDNPHITGNINLSATVIIYALVVLLIRAIFVVQVDVTKLGLAIGICGWLMTWLAQMNLTPSPSLLANRGVRDSSLIWETIGSFLLLLGWAVAVTNYPVQAIAVSGLGLWFIGNRVQRYSGNADSVVFFAVGLQTIWLGWRLLPTGLQEWAIATGTHLTNSQNQPWALLSIALFPYIILMVALTNSFHRQQREELAKFGELLTLFLGTALTTIALVNPTLRSLNFLSSTLTLAFVTQRYSHQQTRRHGGDLPLIPLIYLTHIMGILTLFSTMEWLLPTLSLQIWASILLALMVLEWGFSLRNSIWGRSAWYIGLGLAAISFLLLWGNLESFWTRVIGSGGQWGIIWLITPLALYGVASRTTGKWRIANSVLSFLAVGISQLLTLPPSETRLIGLGVGAVLMFGNTRYLRKPGFALITEGFTLVLIGVLLWEGVPGLPHLSLGGWFIVGAIAILSLWLGRVVLMRREDELANIYAAASDKWAIALCILELLSLTMHSLLVYDGHTSPGLLYLITTIIILGAIIYRSWRSPTNWAFYSIGWCGELLMAELLGFAGHSTIKIAIANIALGLITQLVGEWWRQRYQLERFPSSFHILPLIYAALSIVLRLDTFSNSTGLYSLGVALIIIGVGRRRQEFKPLLYLGIIGVSISAYELLFYQISQTTGGGFGDGLIAMSALGTSIMYAYRILSPILVGYLRLTPQQLQGIAHLHWTWSSCLLIVAIILPVEVNQIAGLGTGGFLIQYAIFQGRENLLNPSEQRILGVITPEIWVYLGLLEAGIFSFYLKDLPIAESFTQNLLPWNSAIACVVAYFLYILPWERWGWSPRPWRNAAYILPLIILWITGLEVSPISLVIVAGFYIFLAKVGEKFRFTYISVALIDWALFDWFFNLNLTDSLWYVSVIGLSLLYIAQVDPQLTLPQSKGIRHSLRIFGSGLICGWAILFYQNIPIIPGIFSLIAIFAGLALQIRAFLYVGTVAFFCTSIYQLVIFSLRYPFLKWIIGLLVGIILISIAANFETRRAQITSLLRNTSDGFHQWE